MLVFQRKILDFAYLIWNFELSLKHLSTLAVNGNFGINLGMNIIFTTYKIFQKFINIFELIFSLYSLMRSQIYPSHLISVISNK